MKSAARNALAGTDHFLEEVVEVRRFLEASGWRGTGW